MNVLAQFCRGFSPSTRRLTGTVACVFAVQVIAVWLIGERPKPPVPSEEFPTRVHLPGALGGWSSAGEFPLLQDAALLPLPGVQGFSRGAWLQYSPVSLALADWKEQTNWLVLDATAVDRAISQMVDQHEWVPARSFARATLDFGPEEARTSALVPMAASRLSITGDLAARPLERTVSLRSWPHEEILTNTVVQVTVDEEGGVYSAVLLRGCGAAEPDRFAMQAARTMRFAALSPGEQASTAKTGSALMFGRLLFHWHTLPAPARPGLDTAQTAN